MKKEQRRKTHLLPSRAPKKTGKRGPRPVDSEEHELVEAGQQLSLIQDSALEDVEQAAHAYVAIRDRRMRLTLDEVSARNVVLDKMKAHGKKVYRRADMLITITETVEKVKVKIGSEEEEEEGDD